MNYFDIIGIGMGPQDITLFHMELIKNCNLLIGGTRQLALFPDYAGESITITGDIPGLVKKIQEALPSRQIVVLASGDPLFFGIGSTLSRFFAPKQLRVHPNISSLSAAFAKIELPWQDAKIISLHGRQPDQKDFPIIFDNDKLFFLTSPSMGPAFIAEQLKASGRKGFKFCVLENLGDQTKEKITWFTDNGAVLEASFSNPNVVILAKENPSTDREGEQPIVPHETHLGMPEHAFHHTRGLITKSEIRVLSLSKLRLTRQNLVIWDIGSGSGSVSVEAALMVPEGKIFAIEKEVSRVNDIKQNIKTYGLDNIFVHEAAFPEGIDQLETPDRIFIGGGGKGLKRIIQAAAAALLPGGMIVINTVVLNNMVTAIDVLSDLGFTPELTHVQVSRSATIGCGTRLSPLNPVWIISGIKPLER